MSKKTKTAWDSVPKEERKKLIVKGAAIAVIALAVGVAIAFSGIVYNPMWGH